LKDNLQPLDSNREEPSLKELVSDLTEAVKEQPKKKKFKLPFRSRVSKKRMREGYVTLVLVNENRGVDFRREPIIEGTIKVDDTFHAIQEQDLFVYKNKPIVFMAKNKLNPYNPLAGDNETYGQKHVMARMESDKISAKKKVGIGIGIVGLIVAGIVVYALIRGV